MYMVLFVVPDLTDDPLCPGTSLVREGEDVFTHVTNSPADEGGCDDYPFPAGQLVEPPLGALSCGPLIFYRTSIPIEESGQLWASVERYDGNLIFGITGAVATDGAPPELNPIADAYDFGEGTELDGVLPPGETVVTC